MKNPKTNPISLIFEFFSQKYVEVIALSLTFTACYLWIEGREVPKLLENLLLVVIGAYFGGKINHSKSD